MVTGTEDKRQTIELRFVIYNALGSSKAAALHGMQFLSRMILETLLALAKARKRFGRFLRV